MFGTNPNDASARFGAVVTVLGGTSQVAFPSVAGRSYRVDYCDDLRTGMWLPLQTIAATSALTSVVDNTVPKPESRFYRVTPL